MSKILLIISIMLSVTSLINSGKVPEEFIDVAPDVRATCLEKSGVAEELVEKVVIGEFTDDEKLKCYLKCFLDQFRLVSNKGINFNAFTSLTPSRLRNSAAKAVKACRNTTGKPGDLCDLSYNVVKCIQNAIPDTFFIL